MPGSNEVRTIRILMYEVWENPDDECPLLVTNDSVEAHAEKGETDTLTTRWWVREGIAWSHGTPVAS